jgi:hypothetical protein
MWENGTTLSTVIPAKAGIQGKRRVDCTLRVRHGNQGRFWMIEIGAGGTARPNLDSVASYSSGDR